MRRSFHSAATLASTLPAVLSRRSLGRRVQCADAVVARIGGRPMSAAPFDCPGCGKRARAAFGAVFIYEGIALKYTLCKSCGTATAKKFENILERVDLALMQPQVGRA